jgi:hypothetical protein
MMQIISEDGDEWKAATRVEDVEHAAKISEEERPFSLENWVDVKA